MKEEKTKTKGLNLNEPTPIKLIKLIPVMS